MSQHKNILLVFTDQMRFDAIEAYGNPVIKTPVLNGLIDEGVSFNRAYTPCPVCVPARYSMHTGLMPHQTGVFENTTMPDNHRSFMEILADHGYQNFGVGKMHFAFETGFSTKWGFTDRQVCDEDEDLEKNDFYQNNKANGYGHVYDYKGVRSEMYYVPQVSQLPADLHHSSWTVNCSIDYLENRDKDKPFFMMTSFEKPHPPFEPPVPWNKLYRGPDMPLPKRPEGAESLLTLWNKFQNRYKYRDQGTDDNLIKQMKAHYYAEVSYLDYNLGRLFDYMESKQLLDNTLVVFTADHGEFLGDYNCFGKRSFLDSAARIPMIVKHPEFSGQSTCDTPVSLVDLMPTFLSYAGIDYKEPLDGVDLLALAEGLNQRAMIYGQYEQGDYANYMATDGCFKYIYSAPDQKEILLDLKSDPEETRNKALNPLYYEKVKEMRQKTIDYFMAEGYDTPFENGRWKVHPVKEMPDDPDAYLLFQDPAGSIPKIPGYTTDTNQKKHFNFLWYDQLYGKV